MDLAELIEPGRVVYGARASNKQQLLQDLASRAATLLNLDAQTIFTALQAREELGSTGLGNGFAHARIEGLDRLFGVFTRLNRPIYFDSIDGNPVDLVFSYSSRRLLAASISPPSLLSRGTCATRNVSEASQARITNHRLGSV
jgi:mannitol/fructose-specific phosphotransferase system IIA component (Ntr-type)